MELFVLPLLVMVGLGFVWLDVHEIDDSDTDPDLPPNVADFGSADNDADGTLGTDIYKLGDGADRARMGAGSDTAFGEAGDDQITGGSGDDRIYLGGGDDQNFLTRSDGNDLSTRNFAGNDIVRGGDGDDRVVDYGGSNKLYGGLGDDLLDGVDEAGTDKQADRLFGGAGADVIFGDSGDVIRGGGGTDSFGVVLDASPQDPAVIKDFAAGERLFVSVPLLFAASDAVLEQDGDDLALRVADTTLLVLKGVSDPDAVDLVISASDIADQTLTPGALLLGTNGDDDLTTGKGDDAVFAGRGADEISSGGGDDYVSLRTARPFEAEGDLGWGSNTVDAGAGADQVLGGLSDDVIYGRGGGDVLLGGGGADVLDGGGGADRIDGDDAGRGGADTIFGGTGNDVISADNGDLVSGGAGADTIIVQDFAKGDAVVTVTDFDPDRDVLDIAVSGGPLTVSYEDTGSATRVMVGGRAVFDLNDITPRDMRGVEIRVSTYA